MRQDTSWRLGASTSLVNRVYDGLRRTLNRDLVAYLMRTALSGREDAFILEAGSGTAFASSVLAQQPRVRRAVALDHDLQALREGCARDPGLPAVTGDLVRLPFTDDCFDLVWNSSTLEHLPDPAAAVREMARITRPGGAVFVGVPFTGGPLGFQRWIAQTGVGIWIGPVYSQARLAALLESAGLQPRAPLIYFLRFFVGMLAIKP